MKLLIGLKNTVNLIRRNRLILFINIRSRLESLKRMKKQMGAALLARRFGVNCWDILHL